MVRKIFSILLILFLIPLFTIFLIAISLKFSILNPNFLKTTLEKVDVYNILIDQGAPALLNSIGDNGKFGMGPLNAEDLSQIVRKSIDVSWLKTQTEKTIGGFFDFSYGKTSKMEIVIPLSEFKKSIAENLTKILSEKVPAMPECTGEELQELQNSESMSFSCRPSGMDSAEISSSLAESITGPDGLLTKLPDQFNLGEAIAKNPQKTESIQRFFTILNYGFQILWIALLVIIGLIILINRKYPSAMLKWIAIPTLVISSIVLLLSLIGSFVAKLMISGYLNMVPDELKPTINSLQGDLLAKLSYYFLLFSAIFAVASIVLIIIASIINKKRTQNDITSQKSNH